MGTLEGWLGHFIADYRASFSLKYRVQTQDDRNAFGTLYKLNTALPGSG